MPRGKRTRSPWTSAPASRNRRSASASPRNSSPTSWRIVSAFSSMIESPSSLRISNGLNVRVRYGSRSTFSCWLARSATRPARPPARRPWAFDHQRSSEAWATTAASPASFPTLARAGRLAAGHGSPGRQLDGEAEMRHRRRLVGEGHRLDEVLLEARLDRGLDLLDLADDRLDLAPGRAREEGDERAGPGRVAGRAGMGEVAVGHEAEDHRVQQVDLAAERPGEPDLVDLLDAEVVHEQADAGVQGGLGELDRPHVVLGHDDPRRALALALVEDVRERPAVRDDPRRARRERPVDDPVGRDDAGQEHLGDDLDDARPADAGHAEPAHDALEARLVRPARRADDPEARLERLPVDADPLDRARRGPLAAADLGALEGRAGGARGGQQPVLVAEDDLGVRADVHGQAHDLGAVGLLGQDDARPYRRPRGRRCTAGRRPGRPGGGAGRARRPSSAPRGRSPARTARTRAGSGRSRGAGDA